MTILKTREKLSSVQLFGLRCTFFGVGAAFQKKRRTRYPMITNTLQAQCAFLSFFLKLIL